MYGRQLILYATIMCLIVIVCCEKLSGQLLSNNHTDFMKYYMCVKAQGSLVCIYSILYFKLCSLHVHRGCCNRHSNVSPPTVLAIGA